MKLPLTHRLPNPPAVFLGREPEVQRLHAAIQRAPVVLVVGPGGYGKSALVRYALSNAALEGGGAELLPAVLPAILVEVRPGDTLPEALVTLGRLLATAESGNKTSAGRWHRAAADPVELIGAVLDLAERAGVTVIVEDLHHDETDPTPLVQLLAAHADASRWVFTTRTALEIPGLAEQVVTVGPLSQEAARDLAERCGAKDSTVDGLTSSANGSPLAIRQGASGAATMASTDQVPASVLPLLRVLATLQQPVTAEALGKLVGAMPASEELSALQDAGWLADAPGDDATLTRLHDVVREQMASTIPAEERADVARRAADVLPGLGEGALVEALSGALASGLTERVKELLDVHGDDLLVGGRGLWLWRRLADPENASDKLTRWSLRAATVVGSPETLAWATSLPIPTEPQSLLLWLEAQMQSGGYAEVLAQTDDKHLEALTKNHRAAALVKRSRALLVGGHIKKAVAILETVQGDDDYTLAHRDAYLAKGLMLCGDYRRATALMRALQPRVERLPPLERDAIDVERTQVAVALGGQRETAPLFGLGSPAGTGRRRAHLLSAINGLLSGNREAVDSSLSKVESLGSPFDRIIRRFIGAMMSALDGDAESAREQCDGALEEAVTSNLGALIPWAISVREMMGRFLDQVWCEEVPPESLPALPLAADLTLINDYIRILETTPPDTWPDLPEPESRSTQQSFVDTLLEIGWSRVHFMRGEYLEADLFCSTAVRRAVETGWGMVHVVALMTRLPLVAALDKRELLLSLFDELSVASERLDSKLVEDWTEFWSAAAQAVPKVQALLGLAATGAAPARNLARAALTHGDDLGAYASRCDQAVRACWQGVSVRRQSPTPRHWGKAWILDLHAKRIVSPEGEVLSLSRQTIGLQILTVVAASQYTVSKEMLATEVWDLSDYHPIRDDNRLHVSINRLRKVMQRLEGASDLFCTLTDGYSLSLEVPLVVLIAVQQPVSA